ncbi:hypothetical protein KA005_41865, partial [bacterium]|nr:hypothetical protein [bacterium]
VAVTGRLTSSSPNLQQLPRDDKEFDFSVRALFIASEGKSLIAADFGGQELRILADLSQDPKMLKAFRENIDLHLMLANQMLELGLAEEVLHEDHPDYEAVKAENKDARYKAKNGVNFPIIYGTTSYGISKNLGVSEEKAQHFIDTFMGYFTGAAKSMKMCNRFLFRNKYVYTKTGRRRRFLYIDDRAKRQAFNFLIQGTAADMVKAAMVTIRKIIIKHPEWEMKIVLTVHDEVVVEVLNEYVDIAKQAVNWAMVNSYKLSIPLVAELGVGKNYSAAK